jgi:hypothetical protein
MNIWKTLAVIAFLSMPPVSAKAASVPIVGAKKTVRVRCKSAIRSISAIAPTEVSDAKFFLSNVPIRNADIPLLSFAQDTRAVNVSKSSVEELVLIDNRKSELGIGANKLSVYQAPAGLTIISGVKVSGEETLVLHLAAASKGMFRPQRNYTVSIDLSSELPKVGGLVAQPNGDWHIRSLIKWRNTDEHFDLLRKIEAHLDQDANVQRFGNFTVGNTSKLLGQATIDGSLYAYFIRDYDDDVEVTDLASLGRALDNTKGKLTIVKVDLANPGQFTYVSADIAGRYEQQFMLRSEQTPTEFYMLKAVSGTSYQDGRTPNGDLNLVHFDLSHIPWLPAKL